MMQTFFSCLSHGKLFSLIIFVFPEGIWQWGSFGLFGLRLCIQYRLHVNLADSVFLPP